MIRYDQHCISTPESSPPPDVKGKGVAGQPSKKTNLKNTGFIIFYWVISSHTKTSQRHKQNIQIKSIYLPWVIASHTKSSQITKLIQITSLTKPIRGSLIEQITFLKPTNHPELKIL